MIRLFNYWKIKALVCKNADVFVLFIYIYCYVEIMFMFYTIFISFSQSHSQLRTSLEINVASSRDIAKMLKFLYFLNILNTTNITDYIHLWKADI